MPQGMRLVSRFHGLALKFTLGMAWLAVALPACDEAGQKHERGQEEEHEQEEEDGGTAPPTVTVVAPTITVQPAAQTVTEPAAAMFSVTTRGTTPAHQWQLSSDEGASWTDLAGETNPDFDTGPTRVAMSGTLYRVRVENSAGSVTSMAAELTVNAAPEAFPRFTQMPADQHVAAGTAAAFSAHVEGYPAPRLQWQRSNGDGASWYDIPGAVSETYSTGPTRTADEGARFRLFAENSAGGDHSDFARLSVDPGDFAAPVFDTHPVSAIVRAGTPAEFSALARGVPTPTYQWQKSVDGGASWTDIAGAHNSRYVVAAAALADNGSLFRVVATNLEGSKTSEIASLYACTSGPLSITHDPTFWAYNQQRNGTGGIFCPGTPPMVEPHPGYPNALRVYGYVESNMSSTAEGLSFSYYPTTGELIDVSYGLESPTLLLSWLCSTGSSYYKPCGGVTLDIAGGRITFSNTIVGEEMGSGALTFSGTLDFPAP